MEKQQIEEAARKNAAKYQTEYLGAFMGFKDGAEFALSLPSNTSLEELQKEAGKLLKHCLHTNYGDTKFSQDRADNFMLGFNKCMDFLLPHLQTKPADEKAVSKENLHTEFKPVVDTEELKKKYFKDYGGLVNFSGEAGDLTPKLFYELFDWFISKLQPSISVTPKEEWISVEDRLADKNEKVLVFFDYGDKQTVEIDYCSKEQKANFITHWKPITLPLTY
ncbi:MAG: DUF551 domain-containing protein [Bacteroidota bacterium]